MTKTPVLAPKNDKKKGDTAAISKVTITLVHFQKKTYNTN